MSAVYGPSRGTLDYWTGKYMREQNLSEKDAKNLAYATWAEHHQNCPAASFHKIKEAYTPFVLEYVGFFVGAANYDAYKTGYNNLWSNRETKFDHKYFRPWYNTSYSYAKRGETYQPTSGEAMASLSKYRPKRTLYCNKCAMDHEFEFAWVRF
jgi:hypothetical protein